MNDADIVKQYVLKILSKLIEGQDQDSIAKELVGNKEFTAEHAQNIVNLAIICSHAAMDIEEGIPEKKALKEITDAGIEIKVALDIVKAVGELLNEAQENAASGASTPDIEQLCSMIPGATKNNVEATITIAECVFMGLNEGVPANQLKKDLVDNGLIGQDLVDSFFEHAILAKEAASKIKKGSSMESVLDEYQYSERPPYFTIMTYKLVMQ